MYQKIIQNTKYKNTKRRHTYFIIRNLSLTIVQDNPNRNHN
jgi:hypothetical protein